MKYLSRINRGWKKRPGTLVSVAFASLALASCITQPPLQGRDEEFLAKSYPPPPEGMGGLYVYADGNGAYSGFQVVPAISKIFVDGHYVGRIWGSTFLWRHAVPGKHTIMVKTPAGFQNVGDDIFLPEGSNVFVRVLTESVPIPGGMNVSWTISKQTPEEAKKRMVAFRLAENSDSGGSDLRNARKLKEQGSVPAGVESYRGNGGGTDR